MDADKQLKVLTWNVNKAAESRSALWDAVRREEADVVLLQEVVRLPADLQSSYNCRVVTPTYFRGGSAPFATAILSKGEMDTRQFLTSRFGWVNRIQSQHHGWILESEVTTGSGTTLRVVSVHSPAFAIPTKNLLHSEFAGIKLANNPRLWITEILWALLRDSDTPEETNWVVGGDFNSSVLFDHPRDRGNGEIIRRMNALGLKDCLSYYMDGDVPTFRHSGGSITHQLDYCYVSAGLLERLRSARVLSHQEVFGPTPKLSDHLPIVCESDF
ncbi:MAG: endonuclease/exonuclease/phosphatase family protein [bacterium]|nr:endonuclease/exonuclease/phosphatase family protein [bacterium]